MQHKLSAIVSSVLAMPVLALAPMAHAAVTMTVNPANTLGWSTADTRPGGAVEFVNDSTAVLGTGALRLTNDGTNASKAQFMHPADNVSLMDVSELGYQTKQVSGPAHAAASYQLAVDLNGSADGGFTTFVYEPYENGTVSNGNWQSWDVDAGQMWSSKSFSDGASCTVAAGAGGAPFYTLANLMANCSNAVVVGYGVNVGTYNPGYDVEVDGVTFNDATYDFEWAVKLANKEACKNDGWKVSNSPVYKNQGDCVSALASQDKAAGNPVVNFLRNLL